MEPKSLFKSATRKPSISEKDKLSKKTSKKRKKGKRRSVEEVLKQPTPSSQESDKSETSKQQESADVSDTATEAQCQPPKISPGLSPVNLSSGVSPSESQSVNTDLSESTISLISSNGNSQTDLLEPTSGLTTHTSNLEIVTESFSACTVKQKTHGTQSATPRTGRTQSGFTKSLQRSSFVQGGAKKNSNFNKSKSSNAFVQNSKGNVKSKPAKETEGKMDSDGKIWTNQQSLRWELTLDDPEQEKERLKVYKINRRKRYLAAAQARGLGWASEYSESGNPERDTLYADDKSEITLQQSASNYSSVQSLVPVTVHTIKGNIFVNC